MNNRIQRGAAAIEFAIVAPLLLALLFGIIEFAIALFDQAMITNASREGARAGIVFNSGTPITDAEIRARVSNYLGNHLISLGGSSSHTTDRNCEGMCTSGDDLTVPVGYTYRFLVLRPLVALMGGDLPSTLNLSATTVMRME